MVEYRCPSKPSVGGNNGLGFVISDLSACVCCGRLEYASMENC